MSNLLIKPSSKVRLKSVALPVEHGGWAFLAEPLLIGLFIAPSTAGWLLSVSVFGVFLLYQPLKIAVKDYLKGKRYPRTAWAERFAAIYAFIAVVALIPALLTIQAPIWIPILLGIPFACLQLLYAVSNRGREIASELAGAIALSMSAPTIVIAAGWPLTRALALCAIPAGRGVASIFYVHSRLHQEQEKNNIYLALILHSLNCVFLAGLAAIHLIPWLATLPALILLGRAWFGLSPKQRTSLPANMIGFQELAYGLLGVILVVIGYH